MVKQELQELLGARLRWSPPQWKRSWRRDDRCHPAGSRSAQGGIHPVTRTMERIEEFFTARF